MLNLENFIHIHQVRSCAGEILQLHDSAPRHACPDPGDYGKQGGERFRTNQKYPAATDTATKRTRDNDTSVIRGPATMKAGRLDSYEAASQTAAW